MVTIPPSYNVPVEKQENSFCIQRSVVTQTKSQTDQTGAGRYEFSDRTILNVVFVILTQAGLEEGVRTFQKLNWGTVLKGIREHTTLQTSIIKRRFLLNTRWREN
jgi:hypothetical protein